MYEADPDAELVSFYLDNVNGEQFNRIYAPTGMYIAVPASCEHPENAIKYLDFLADYDNAKVLQYGFEGVHYELDGNEVITITPTDEEKSSSEYDYERITCGDMMLVYNGNPYGFVPSSEGMEPAKAKANDLGTMCLKSALVGGQVDYNFQGIRTEADEEYAGIVSDPQTNIPLLISCSPEEFDDMYDSVLNDYLEAGGQEIIDQKIALYKELEAAK